MLDDKKDDVFLSRWINGELSEEELNTFKSHPDYPHYIKIMEGSNTLQLKDFDVDKELSKLKSAKQYGQKKADRSTIKLWPFFAAAASIAIIAGIFLFGSDTSFSADYGQQLSVALPDGSEMILNAKSTASFDEENWKENRIVSLQGEAFFKVKKGSKFTVVTKHGEVSVLGTQFNVQTQKDWFEVMCFEGKVSVTNNKNQAYLTAGKGYRSLNNASPEHWDFEIQNPSWLTHTSTFRSIPIHYVFDTLEKQYNITIKIDETLTNTLYTGTFPNNNKEVALNTVFSTLGKKYRISKDGKTVVLEK